MSAIYEFFSMGGFGLYVWMSMGMALGLMIAEVLYLRHQRQQLLKNIARLNRLDKRANRA